MLLVLYQLEFYIWPCLTLQVEKIEKSKDYSQTEKSALLRVTVRKSLTGRLEGAGRIV